MSVLAGLDKALTDKNHKSLEALERGPRPTTCYDLLMEEAARLRQRADACEEVARRVRGVNPATDVQLRAVLLSGLKEARR